MYRVMADVLDVNSGSAKFAKKGRRAKKTVKDKDEFDLHKASDIKTNNLPECKIGGWNEGEISHSVWFGKRYVLYRYLNKHFHRADEDTLDFCKALRREESDEELEIPIVPDLSSVEDQSTAFQGAVAPSVVINKIPAYCELSQDLLNHGTLQLLDGNINLRVLTKHLFSESELQEIDETWSWDFLFSKLKTLK
ncbi:unnamed protein product [Schistosoma mattheei]|uniref:Uncharacterized protein n=1 Tax=Schistosoma mattheei TaxID=31246 RepID=A0AA85B5V6_9TREM|nr:unnamed protein product [Schistosoma mattheei]